MQLQRLQAYLQQYRDWLPRPAARDRLYLWESQKIWQENWDLSAVDLAATYDRSLDNSQTRRLWRREAYEPKRMMLELLRLQPEFGRSMFQDLFNENKEVEGRADRFVFYCDQLLAEYRERFPLRADNSHYHDDGYSMISLYLSFRFPDRYAPYTAADLLGLLQKLSARDLPAAGDLGRHVKLMRTLYNFLQKDELIMQRHRKRLDEQRHYVGDSLLLSYDFQQFVNTTTKL